MLKDIKSFLACNKQERTGIFILITVILLVLVLGKTYPLRMKEMVINDPALIATLDSLLRQDSILQKKPDSFFFFDPNKTGKQEWMLLGLSERQAEVVMNYSKAGGRFYRKEDVKKLYSIDDELYQKLEAFIVIGADTIPEQPESPEVKIELNTADSSALISLYGIGPAFTRRILAYRGLLGGFYEKEQLLEIYGMDSSRFAGFSEQFFIDTAHITKINILTADFKEVLRHPYVSYELTKFIFNNRDKIRKKGTGTLFEFDQMNDSLFQKITPYLSLN